MPQHIRPVFISGQSGPQGVPELYEATARTIVADASRFMKHPFNTRIAIDVRVCEDDGGERRQLTTVAPYQL